MISEAKEVFKPTNCMDCPFKKVFRDPDPDDWFNDDDEGVECTKMKRNVTTACRPYNKRKECETPVWCPLPVAPKN